MRSKNRTKAESDWHKSVSQFATESDWLYRFRSYCSAPKQFHLDHILGAQAKRKVFLTSEKIGELVVIPVPIELHDVNSNHKLNVTKYKKSFEHIFGPRLQLWLDMVNSMSEAGFHIPFDKDVIEAVMRG